MRQTPGRIGRIVVCLVAAVLIGQVPAAALGAAPSAEVETAPLAQRWRAVQHGGIAHTANSVITCREPAAAGPFPLAFPALSPVPDCADAQAGAPARNGQYEMAYIDTDSDPHTYNSSTAELALPPGATVTLARLYWGGNLRAGEQKPAGDNGRVLFAEPGGQYKEVLADTVIGHRDSEQDDAFAASADVTDIVRHARPGSYTVGQINVAMGHSPAGTWGGWTLLVAYEHPDEPLRDLSLWDGFEHPGGAASASLTLDDMELPADAAGRIGFVAYDGDRGVTGDSLTARADRHPAVRLAGDARPADDVMNSTVDALDAPPGGSGRNPAHRNTLGYDSGALDLGPALTRGAHRLTFGFSGGGDDYHLGAVFVQADVTA
ncbi:DUF3344 domain-containing protein [Streptomyces aidingensis]|uniref:DUF3344 domain-containing protein n=1 Tax=Streptomyces aidingensis TaxID=910347 RepID=A0A1I1QMI8_9ACTN|nr:DUF3344 domain-containing protein [Streptomyces aidingensis]SFD23351.1 hypothetical protein SAMN05421773_111185 [Streptomyces aidingensis]